MKYKMLIFMVLFLALVTPIIKADAAMFRNQNALVEELSICDNGLKQLNTSYLENPGIINIPKVHQGATYARDRLSLYNSSYIDLSNRGDGIPFGFWGLNGYHCTAGYTEVNSRFNTTTFQVASEGPNYTAYTLLPAVADANSSVTIRMTGDYTGFADEQGDFSLTLWEESLANWNDSEVLAELQTYSDNQTFIGHMILDDIYNYSGDDPTAEELETMACYSKELMPEVMTFVREDISYLQMEDPYFQFECLDAVGLQYSAVKGDINSYIDEQYTAANDLNLDVIPGLNLLDGGDGTSGQPGSRESFYAMSAEEITTYGEALLEQPDIDGATSAELRAMPGIRMFLMWEYDAEDELTDGTIRADYIEQSDTQQAIYNLGQRASQCY